MWMMTVDFGKCFTITFTNDMPWKMHLPGFLHLHTWIVHEGQPTERMQVLFHRYSFDGAFFCKNNGKKYGTRPTISIQGIFIWGRYKQARLAKTDKNIWTVLWCLWSWSDHSMKFIPFFGNSLCYLYDSFIATATCIRVVNIKYFCAQDTNTKYKFMLCSLNVIISVVECFRKS